MNCLAANPEYTMPWKDQHSVARHSSTPIIRSYSPDDLDRLIDVFRASVREVARRDYTQEQVLAWAPDAIDQEAWARSYSQRHVWVAEIEGAIAGFSDL